MADTVLLLPGWQNSGPDHWQSRWEATFGYQRVEQHDWMRPLRGDWVARLQEVVLAHEKTPGRPQVFSHPLGGPGDARAGGAQEKTPGRSQVFLHPLGGPGDARAGGAHEPAKPGAADIVLVAHSLGCLLVATWAAFSPSAHRVKAALLVAPGDPQRDELAGALSSWTPITLEKLPFPSVLLGSHNDPYCDFRRAHTFADAWGSQFVDYGHAGHINADSGLGGWPDGHARLQRLCMAKK